MRRVPLLLSSVEAPDTDEKPLIKSNGTPTHQTNANGTLECGRFLCNGLFATSATGADATAANRQSTPAIDNRQSPVLLCLYTLFCHLVLFRRLVLCCHLQRRDMFRAVRVE